MTASQAPTTVEESISRARRIRALSGKRVRPGGLLTAHAPTCWAVSGLGGSALPFTRPRCRTISSRPQFLGRSLALAWVASLASSLAGLALKSTGWTACGSTPCTTCGCLSLQLSMLGMLSRGSDRPWWLLQQLTFEIKAPAPACEFQSRGLGDCQFAVMNKRGSSKGSPSCEAYTRNVGTMPVT